MTKWSDLCFLLTFTFLNQDEDGENINLWASKWDFGNQGMT